MLEWNTDSVDILTVSTLSVLSIGIYKNNILIRDFIFSSNSRVHINLIKEGENYEEHFKGQ